MCCLTQLKRWGVTLHMWFDSGTHEVPSRSACPPSLSLPHLQGCFWYQIAYDNCKKHQAFILWGISPAGKRSPLFFFTANQTKQGFPGGSYGKESACIKLFLFFIFPPLGGGSKKISLQFMSGSILPMFSSRSFIESGLTFGCLIHFEFILVYGVRECSSFSFFKFSSFPSTAYWRACLFSFVID